MFDHPDPLIQSIQFFFGFFAGLFPMVNPFSTAPLFLSLTRDAPVAERERQARMAARYAGIIMLVTMLVGGLVLEFLGISIAALRVAGGLIVAYLGFQMLFPQPVPSSAATSEGGAAPKQADYSFMPLAFPSLAGPGTIAVIMSFTTKVAAAPTWEMKVVGYAIIGAVIVVMSILAAILLRASTGIMRWLGPQGLDAMARLMGLALVCLGVQFVADGVRHV